MNPDNEKMKEIEKLVEMVNNSEISSIKQTVTRIIDTINNPESSAKDLKDIIEIDPPLTARLLKLANSAFYGYPKTISEVQEAIVCIGFDAVRELALSQKVCELFQKDDYLFGYSRISLWKHCVAVALCSKLIYRREFRERGENLYVAGLLHDIGIIVLDQFQNRRFMNILRKFRKEKKNQENIEIDFGGYSHTDIGKALAENWEFPDEMVQAIANHHNPDYVEEEYEKISLTIFISDYIIQNKCIGYRDAPYKNNALFQKCLMKLKIKEKAINFIVKEVENEIGKMEKTGWF